MFHTIITLAYIIPNVYVSLRILQIFIKKGHRLRFTVAYIAFALIYPISNLFDEGGNGIVASVLATAANYLLPFYLYLFLFVLFSDILLLVNLVFKLIPAERIGSGKFKAYWLSGLIILPLIIVIGGIINFNTIRETEYNITIPAKLSGIRHLKVAFVSDFHLQQETNVHFAVRFADMINEVKPDILLFGGDIVEGDRDDGNLALFEKLLSGIKTRYGSYAVLGNHEYYAGQDNGSFFNMAGIKVLCDTSVVIDHSLNLSGRYDSHFSARKNINDLMGTVNDSFPVILVDHRPTEIERVSTTKTDIQLSGHTHHGQLFPINLITSEIYRLSYGYRQIGNTHFFVSSGIRLWGPPVRTAGRSEIMIINIAFSG